MKKYLCVLLVSAGLLACSHGGAGTVPRPMDTGARTLTADTPPSVVPAAPSMDEDATLMAQRAPAKPATPATPPAANGPKEAETASDATPLTRRLIVYAAALSVGVFEPEKSAQSAIELAEKLGGYMKSRSNNDVVVRVPAEQFFAFVKELEAYGHMASRVINSQDITSQFVDLTIRLNNLLITRTRLQAILEKARNVEETLAVERELNRVSGEIEQIKGRLRLFQNLVDFATVQLSFFMRHGQSSVTPNPVKVDTPIYWIKRFDVVTLFRN
ncbi:DUF4349 domain-containing protein [Myxococcota bacterium]|nr:DUF4349 domain-containing protein [Myxococcota bacterium]